MYRLLNYSEFLFEKNSLIAKGCRISLVTTEADLSNQCLRMILNFRGVAVLVPHNEEETFLTAMFEA